MRQKDNELQEKDKEIGIMKSSIDELFKWKASMEQRKKNGIVGPKPNNVRIWHV